MALFPIAWLHRTWAALARFFARPTEAAAPAATPAPIEMQEPAAPEHVDGEATAIFRAPGGGRARVTVESFEAEPRSGGLARLRVRLTNIGKEDLPYGQVTLVWWGSAGREGAPLARQPALALPSTLVGGTAAFETRLPVPQAAIAQVFVLVEPAGGDAVAWAAEEAVLLLERQVLAAVVPAETH